eukprot:5681480-Amphidinium_carterae.1
MERALVGIGLISRVATRSRLHRADHNALDILLLFCLDVHAYKDLPTCPIPSLTLRSPKPTRAPNKLKWGKMEKCGET